MKLWACGAMVAAIGAALSAMAACGGSGSGAGGDTSASNSTATSSTSGSPVGAECAMRLTKQECFTCCEMQLLMENKVLISDLVEACACAAPDGGVAPPCAGDPSCQMECADKVINDTCIMCINTNAIKVKPQHTCVTAGYKVCEADPNCAPLLDCAFTYCTQAN